MLAAAGAPAVGVRLSKVTLPALSRRRLLALALLTAGVALILAGLVFDFVLVLLLTALAGLAAGIVVSTGRTLLAQEVEEARLPKVTEHLYAVLRVVVGGALVVVPLIAVQVVRSYFSLARLESQRAVAQRTYDQRKQMLSLINQRVSAGLDTVVEQKQGEGALPDTLAQIESFDE